MPIWSDRLVVVAAALVFDALIGDPDAIWRRLPHPVASIGGLIEYLDRKLNRPSWSPSRQRLAGVGAVGLLLTLSIPAGLLIELALPASLPGHLVAGLLASVFIAQRSLYQHVARVRAALADGGLVAGRDAVSMIVGRNPDRLDEPAVCRAAIESCAENFSDGVVAPAFWLAVFGLPGLIAYKAINTADSMIGHRSPRHLYFGWAAARLDDLANLIPARLSGLLLAAVAKAADGSVAAAMKTMRADAMNHRSPNAGWPEGAMAGALGLMLAGPRRYGDEIVRDPFLNAAARRDAAPDDIGRALHILVAACLLEAAIYVALALVL